MAAHYDRPRGAPVGAREGGDGALEARREGARGDARATLPRRRTFLTLGAAGAASILLPRCTDAALQVARRVERAGGGAPTPWGAATWNVAQPSEYGF
jgi:hypothetical protein